MAVPGANRTRLGQGMPGGPAALPGNLPLPGGGTLGPPPGNIATIPVPGAIRQAAPQPVAAPQPANIQTDPRVQQETGGSLAALQTAQAKRQNPGSTKNITVALGILDQVRSGKLDPKKAAKLMQGLTAGDQQGLAEMVAQRNSREGKVNMKELKALQELQKLPAPSDAQPHDLLSNFARDTEGLITGLPSGIGLTAAYAGRDVLNATIPGRKRTSLLKDKILSPIAKQYEDTYSPLIHGDLTGFYKKFHAHPVGPALDLLSLISAGAGAAGRVGAAGEALSRAGLVVSGAKVTSRNGILSHLVKSAEDAGHHDVADELRSQMAPGGHEVQVSYPIVQGQFGGVQELDKSIEALAGEYGGEVVEAGSGMGGRDYSIQFPPGSSHQDFMKRIHQDTGLESHSFPVTEDGSPLLGVTHNGVRDEGGWLQSTDHPDSTENLHDYLSRNAEYDPQSQHALDELNKLGDQPTTLTRGQKARVAVPAFIKAGGKGGLVDLYDRQKGITHEAEIQNTMKDIQSVLDDPDLRLNRRSMKEVVNETAADIRATRLAGKARPAEMAANLPGFISSGSTGKALSAAETTMREASDLVRAGAIYMRPAYLPNNWAGNSFMAAAHQGVLAPVNIAKSFVMDKEIGTRYTRAIDKSMGDNPATVVTSGKGRGYVSSLTQPAAHIMGIAADRPFRRAAWLHEARRAGFNKLSNVKDLMDKAAGGDEASLRQVADISRKAQEEIVKFGHMNETERSVVRNLVFVYSWMRGAGRYAARFPLQHPIQTDAFHAMSGPGNAYTQSIMGGVPSFMSGVVPIGRGKDGNPIVINPFSLNPLGTGLQLLRAAAGTVDVLRNPKTFNKYAQTDVVDLLNPILGAYVNAREGGPSMKKQIENTIAAMALVKGLKHPGSGSIYPTSRSEAVGHFTLGALYPREADQAAVTKANQREQVNNPSALIPQQIADFQKATGQEIPYTLVIAYRKDLEDAAQQKDFQSHYADSHGASGFRNMPPQNRLEAGIEFLRKYGKVKPETVNQIEEASKTLTTDAEYNEFANAVWHLTGVGQWKTAWDSMMRSVKNRALTRKRP